MAEIVVKYLGCNGVYIEKAMNVGPTSFKLQRKKFDMYLDDVTIEPGTPVGVEVTFNNKTESGQILVPTNPQQIPRWYAETLFCELHGEISTEEDGMLVFNATKMHVNLSKGLRGQKPGVRSEGSPKEVRNNVKKVVNTKEKKEVGATHQVKPDAMKKEPVGSDLDFSMYPTAQIIGFMLSLTRELAAREIAKSQK